MTQKETTGLEVKLSDEIKQSEQPSANLLPAAILIGSVLICASIFYNTNLLVKKFDSAAPAPLGAGNALQQQAGQQAVPTGPVDVPNRDGQPTLGSKDARVTIVEFGDFQCPFCQQFFKQTYAGLKKEYVDTGKVKIVFRHYPLAFHQNARISGIAAECANRQGKFWEYHDLLFANGQGDGTNLAAQDLKKYAGNLGLNMSKFNQCLDKEETADIVDADTQAGSAAGVSGTPSFFINGKLLVGAQPLANFKSSIDEALK